MSTMSTRIAMFYANNLERDRSSRLVSKKDWSPISIAKNDGTFDQFDIIRWSHDYEMGERFTLSADGLHGPQVQFEFFYYYDGNEDSSFPHQVVIEGNFDEAFAYNKESVREAGKLVRWICNPRNLLFQGDQEDLYFVDTQNDNGLVDIEDVLN